MNGTANWGRWEPDTSREVLNITPEFQAEMVIVGSDGLPPLTGTHMLVCRIRWYSGSLTFVLLWDGSFLFSLKTPPAFHTNK